MSRPVEVAIPLTQLFAFPETSCPQGHSGRNEAHGKQDRLLQTYTKLVGMYSGCIDKDPDSQLGRVWKASTIDELIQRYK